jgi:2-C-methyl-D-erythritol 4-phosphate cytidylyltransferase
MKNIGIILAGGTGERCENIIPKQYVSINNKLIIQYVIDTFIQSNLFNYVIVVINKKYRNLIKDNVIFVNAGETRQCSTDNALYFIEKNYDCLNVAITDACRPCITEQTISHGLDMLSYYDGIISTCKSVNTSCYIINNKLTDIINRTNMHDMLMPQFFNYNLILEAHKSISNINATDDSQIILKYKPDAKISKINISLWEGLKLTYPEDYKIFEYLLNKEKK